MGCDYCGPPAPPHELDVTPIAAPNGKMSSCQNSCCDSDDAEPLDTTAAGSKMPTPEKSGDCYSPDKCADNKTENHTDTPDCCRGKVSPCCDITCLDRLAMRECEMSAMATPAPNNQPKTCGGAMARKPCSQHRLSTLDRYGATLQALGCICRALIALGRETCCEIREIQSLDRKQCSTKSSARFLRTSLDSYSSNGSVTEDQVWQEPLRSQESSRESTRSSKKVSTDACVASCCSKEKPAKKYPVKSKCSKPCCSEDTPAEVPFVKDNFAKSCDSLENAVKQPAAQTGRLDSCCSETLSVEKSLPKVGYPGSCCPKDQPIKENDAKSIYADPCCSKIKPIIEPITSVYARSSYRTSKNIVAIEPPNIVSSSSCCKLPKQDIVKTPTTNYKDSHYTEKQPPSS